MMLLPSFYAFYIFIITLSGIILKSIANNIYLEWLLLHKIVWQIAGISRCSDLQVLLLILLK